MKKNKILVCEVEEESAPKIKVLISLIQQVDLQAAVRDRIAEAMELFSLDICHATQLMHFENCILSISYS